MAHNFGSLVFTPLVKALQEKYGSRRQYARMEAGDGTPDRLGPDEVAFISERDSFYLATVGATGWPYIQHRGGAKGFLKTIDNQTIAFADFRGNKQYITTGNLASDDSGCRDHGGLSRPSSTENSRSRPDFPRRGISTVD